MKIMHVISELEKGGAERQLSLLVGGSTYEHCVAYRVMAPEKITVAFSCAELIEVKGWRLFKKFVNIFIENKIDVVQLWLPENFTFPALLAAKYLKIPVISCDRRAPVYWGKLAIRDRMKYFIHFFSEKVIFNYKLKFFEHPCLSIIAKIKNAKVIPNGFLIDERVSLPSIKPRCPRRLFCVGRLVPQKNIELLIKAFSSVQVNRSYESLHIIGDGPCFNELLSLASRLGVSDRCFFYGDIRTWMYEFDRNTDLFVFPSRREGMPNVVFEAVLSGYPVITSDINEIRQWFEGSELIFFKSDSKKDLCRKLLSYKEMDDEARLRVSRSVFNKALNYTVPVMSERYDEIYRGLVRND